MEWISVNDKLPPCLNEDRDISMFVWITNGDLIEIARYVYRPRNYGCAVHTDDEKASCGPQPHWHPDIEIPSFLEGDMCYGRIEVNEITHWMHLPSPPNTLQEPASQ